jgi:signal peptidase I
MAETAGSSPWPPRSGPLLAGLLSAVGPGLGQLYNGRLRKFAAIVALALANGLLLLLTIRSPLGLAAGAAVAVAIYLVAVLDAVLDAAREFDRSARSAPRWWLIALAFALATTGHLIIGTALRATARPYRIQTRSMRPTLDANDRFIADMKWYGDHEPRRGDLALCRHPTQAGFIFVKRIVAVAGDTVAVRDHRVWIDGALNDRLEPGEDRSDYPQKNDAGPLVVPAKHVYVLGDCRPESLDSRDFGPLPSRLLLGRPLYIYYAPDLARIGKRLE